MEVKKWKQEIKRKSERKFERLMGKLQELEAFLPDQARRHPAVVLPTLPPELTRRHHAAVECQAFP
jgi:hypothetical protein